MMGRVDGRLGFGKFKGQHVMQIPLPYLEWLSNNVSMDERLTRQVLGAIIARTPSTTTT